MSNPREAFTPQQTVDTLLRIAGTNLILVGGQSLSVWVRYYNVELPDTIPAITLDVDFLTRDAADKKSVSKLARALGGSARYPNIRSLTALVGQALSVEAHPLGWLMAASQAHGMTDTTWPSR